MLTHSGSSAATNISTNAGGGGPARLQGSDKVRRRDDGVDVALRHRRVPAASAQRDVELCAARHDCASAAADDAGGEGGHVVEAKDGVNAVHDACSHSTWLWYRALASAYIMSPLSSLAVLLDFRSCCDECVYS
jgi:hypothetical protein